MPETASKDLSSSPIKKAPKEVPERKSQVQDMKPEPIIADFEAEKNKVNNLLK